MTDELSPLLGKQLAAAAQDLRAQSPPAGLWPAIERALDRRQAPAPQRHRMAHWWGWGGLSTACLALAVWLVVSPLPAAGPTQSADGFVPLASAESWRQAAQAGSGQVWLVSTEMPSARLAALGLPYDPSRAGERVPAQVLLQSTGNVLAVRLAQ